MRVLVLGGTRFIGPAVVRALVAGGAEVTLFHRGRAHAELPPGVACVHGDRAGLAARAPELRAFGAEVVVDMRPLHERDARAVVAAFRGGARRVVAVSSADVYRAYGKLIGTEEGPPDAAPLDEEAPLRERLFPYRAQASGPEDFRHDYDKIPAERVFLGDPGLPGTVLRLPMVYGPGDDQHRLHEYLKRMDDGRPAILLDAGLARWRSCRGYVDDVGRAVALAALDARAAGRVYNVSDEEGLEEAEWVRRIGRAAGWAGEVVTLPRGRLPPHLVPELRPEHDLVLATRRIRDELGFAESVPPDEALRRTVAWERANPPAAVDPAAFDYAAEDTALAALRG